jgi:Flp pilus assembly protein TadG
MKATASRALRNLGRDRRGASAIEFALLAPLMIGLYIGCVEISEGIAADRKVTLTAGAVANLTAQVTTITPADMSNILAASTAIMPGRLPSKFLA